MAVVFNSLSELSAYIETAVNGALADTVVPEVEADFADNAASIVYGAYPEPKYPFEYERKYRLMKTDTYEDEVGGMKATISVNHPYGLLIEYGHGGPGGFYQHPYNREGTQEMFLQDRPFFGRTVDTLRDGRFKELMAQGLREYGLDVH